jgi:serine protease Do
MKKSVTLGSIPSAEAEVPVKEESASLAKLGISISPNTQELREKFGVEETAGVFVTGVLPGSTGHRMGLREGDVVLEVNGETVTDVAKLDGVISGEPKTIAMLILREGRSFYV